MDINTQVNHDSALIESFLNNKTDATIPFDKNDENFSKAVKKNFRKDLSTIFFLMYMYFLQGTILGLSGAIPFILGTRKVSYTAQGTFSFAHWPFSIKLIWAPIVDSLYFKRIGRRRSWIVPVNLFIALFFISFARPSKNLLNNSQTQSGRPINLKNFI